MRSFRNILVGVDIDHGAILDTGHEAVERALWLARLNGASVTFAHVLDASPRLRETMQSDANSDAGRHYRDVTNLLEHLVSSAEGVSADSTVLFGKHWRELIRQVLRARHDLAIVGTKSRGVAGRAIFGSTSMKLLRNCPATVWVTKSGEGRQIGKILVAHDLTVVGEQALRLGADMAQLQNAELHVLHTLEHPESERFLSSIPAAAIRTRQSEARDTITRQANALGVEQLASITVTDGVPYTELLNYLGEHDIDLLIMGTVARTGVSGLITGNTAENVLPWVTCSLMTVKPEDFVSPVTLD